MAQPLFRADGSGYFLNFFLWLTANPINPVPSRIIVAGSGTAVDAISDDLTGVVSLGPSGVALIVGAGWAVVVAAALDFLPPPPPPKIQNA